MAEDAERRSDRRLVLDRPVEFAFGNGGGAAVVHCGRTRNVSPGGVYFEMEGAAHLSEGARIRLRICIPRSALALQGEAEVVRAVRLSEASRTERVGIAARFSTPPIVSLPQAEVAATAQAQQA